MEPVDIGLAYDQLTHLWHREAFDQNNGIAQHNKAVAFAKNKGHALDVGCGCTGRIIELLTENGFTVAGIDISNEMVKLAKERHPEHEFFHDDICKFNFPRQYDFITAWDSIWHIPLAEQVRVIKRIVNNLNPGGIFIFSFGGLPDVDEHKNSAMGTQVYYSTLGLNGFITLLIESGCLIRHLEFDQYPELHAYLIVEKMTQEDIA